MCGAEDKEVLRLDFSLLSPSLNLSKILAFPFAFTREGAYPAFDAPGSGSCWSKAWRAFLFGDDPDDKGDEDVEEVEERGVTRSAVGASGSDGEEELVTFCRVIAQLARDDLAAVRKASKNCMVLLRSNSRKVRKAVSIDEF